MAPEATSTSVASKVDVEYVMEDVAIADDPAFAAFHRAFERYAFAKEDEDGGDAAAGISASKPAAASGATPEGGMDVGSDAAGDDSTASFVEGAAEGQGFDVDAAHQATKFAAALARKMGPS